jgi:hypothetical protein
MVWRAPSDPGKHIRLQGRFIFGAGLAVSCATFRGAKGAAHIPRVPERPGRPGARSVGEEKGRALRLMAIRLARLERVALIASSHQRTINSRPAASRGKKRLDLSARIAWLGAY